MENISNNIGSITTETDPFHSVIEIKNELCDPLSIEETVVTNVTLNPSRNTKSNIVTLDSIDERFTYQCEMCGKKYLSKNRLDYHLDKCHKNIEKVKKVKLPKSVKKNVINKKVKELVKYKCDHCDYKTNKTSSFKRHVITHEKIVNVKKQCHKCHIDFENSNQLDSHFKECLEALKDFTCQLCDTKWVSHISLEYHYVMEHKQKLIACDICGNTFTSQNSIRDHVKKEHGKTFSCEICEKTFGSKTLMRVHVKNEHGKTFSCDTCGEQFRFNLGLRKHKSQAHKTEVKNYKCDDCDKSFPLIPKLDNHLEELNHKLNCEHCDFKTNKVKYLKAHQSRHKKNVLSVEDLKRNCHKCHIEFDCPKLLNSHFTQCLEEALKDFTCKLCESKWVSHISLEFHYVIEHHQKLSVCDICGFSISPKHISNHVRLSHKTEPDFACHMCGDEFKWKLELQKHLSQVHKIQVRPKNYKCDECDMCFQAPCHLKRHKMVKHSNEKTFSCEICDWTGKQDKQLKIHMITKHIRDQVFACELCEYKAFTKQLLTQKVKTHENNIQSIC